MPFRHWRVLPRCFQRGLCITGGWGPIGGSPNVNGDMGEAPSETAVGPSFLARLENVDPHNPRLPDRLMLGLYVLQHEWERTSVDIVAPSSEAAQEIIDRWNPFNKRESSVAHMHNLYPTLLQVQVATRS